MVGRVKGALRVTFEVEIWSEKMRENAVMP